MLDPDATLLRKLKPFVLARTFDVKLANEIVNHPDVLPIVTQGEIENIDLAPVIGDPRNVALIVKGGLLIFGADVEGGAYELHTTFLPQYRGAYALDVSRSAYRWMFTHTDCMEIVTRVPAFNRAAALMARKIGFVPTFIREKAWNGPDGPADLKFYSLTYRDWLLLAAEGLRASGRAFHVRLDIERKRFGFDDPHHSDEDCHDLHVGAAAEMAYGGQPEKAVILYNRWARLAGYSQITFISRSPLVIDIGDAILEFTESSFKVVRCR